MIIPNLLGSICTGKLGSVYSGQVGSVSSEEVGSVLSEFPVAQATKGGNFKGDQSLTHNCDFVIKVMDGIAYQEGRFSPASEIKIFDEPLYQKNKKKIPEIKKSDYIFGEIGIKKKVVLKPFDEAFPNTIKTTKNITNEGLTPIDKKLSSKETSTNLNRINYTMELLKIMDTYEVQFL